MPWHCMHEHHTTVISDHIIAKQAHIIIPIAASAYHSTYSIIIYSTWYETVFLSHYIIAKHTIADWHANIKQLF